VSFGHETPVQIGVLVPLTRPGWTEAGRHLLAGLELAAGEVNDAGGVAGRPLEPVAAEPSVYWASGTRILQDHLSPGGGRVTELNPREFDSVTLCDELAASGATVILLLAGYPDPIVPLVGPSALISAWPGPRSALRPGSRSSRAGWRCWGTTAPGSRSCATCPSASACSGPGSRRPCVRGWPKRFEGYDTVVVLTDLLRHSSGVDRARLARSWPRAAVEGTRGQIRFSRQPGISVWQWAWPPIQVADRDPVHPDRFRTLHGGSASI
jgi:hypothetical protein